MYFILSGTVPFNVKNLIFYNNDRARIKIKYNKRFNEAYLHLKEQNGWKFLKEQKG
jgi:hypothetical protein